MEYAQARMQARHGERPDEAAWRRLAGEGPLDAYLAAARATALAPWLMGIPDRADAHAVERALRQHWREAVAELAGWMPAEWRGAVAWCAGLVDLPALAFLAAGNPTPPWMEKDPALAARIAGPLTLPGRGPWRAAWRQRWPAAGEEDAAQLEHLAGRIEAHLARFAELPPAAARDARLALGLEARRWFRRLALRPPVAFAHLLLIALDLERLRGELVIRTLGKEGMP